LAQVGALEPYGQALVLAVGGLAIHEEAESLIEGEAGAVGRLHLVVQSPEHAEEAERFELGERGVCQHGLVSSWVW
jgi:hypothetical protein